MTTPNRTTPVGARKTSLNPGQQLTFRSTLRRIAAGMNYFAIAVPVKISRDVGSRGPVPVLARVNDSQPFICSLYPVGQGRHFLRIRNQICKAGGIDPGDRVLVHITVRDRALEVRIDQGLMKALRTAGVIASFRALPIGRRSFMIRRINEAALPKTRAKRVQAAVDEARRLKEASTAR